MSHRQGKESSGGCKKKAAEQKKDSCDKNQNDKTTKNQSAALDHGLSSITQEAQPVSKISLCAL